MMKLNLTSILTIALVIVSLLFLKECNTSQSLKDEAKISKQNELALKDSVRVINNAWGEEISVKNALVMTEKELRAENHSLYDDIQRLEGKIKIVQSSRGTIRIVDTIEIKNTVYRYADGRNRLTWSFDTTYNENNRKSLAGYSEFLIDSTGKVLDRGTKITKDEMRIKLLTGLTELDGSYQIFVKTDYPGVTFDKIDGAILDKKIFSKPSTNESNWIIGPYLGVGYGVNPKSSTIGPFVGVGLGVSYNLNKQIKRLFGK